MKTSSFLLLCGLCLASSVSQAGYVSSSPCTASNLSDGTAKNKAIVETVIEFFCSTPRSERFYEVKTHLLSRELAGLVQKAKAEEEWSGECVRNSDSPTDKPKIIESDIYTRSWERHTRMEITHVNSDANSAQISVQFYSDDYTPVIPWYGFISVIRENGQWKIDDILIWNLFRKTISSDSTIREYFLDFLKRHDGCF